MVTLTVFIIIAVAFLTLLLVWFVSQPSRVSAPVSPPQTADLLGIFGLAIPFDRTAARIFAKEDWEFLCSTCPREVKSTFLKERRSLALAWIRRTQKDVSKVLFLYRLAVRRAEWAGLREETRVILSYTAFSVAAYLLLASTWFAGPFRTEEAFKATMGWAEYLANGCARVLASLEPSRLQDVRRAWQKVPA